MKVSRPQIVFGVILFAVFASAANAQVVPCYDPPEDPCVGKCSLFQWYSDATYTTLVGENFNNPCPFMEYQAYQWGSMTSPYETSTCWICCYVCAKNRKPAYKQLPILKANLVFPSVPSIVAASRATGGRCSGS